MSSERKRKMPTITSIQSYWTVGDGQDIGWDHFRQCDPGEPSCYACGAWPSEHMKMTTFFERAHITPHSAGGLDGPQNVVLLCGPCHKAQPDAPQSSEALTRFLVWVKWRRYELLQRAIAWASMFNEAEDPNLFVLSTLPPGAYEEEAFFSHHPAWEPMSAYIERSSDPASALH